MTADFLLDWTQFNLINALVKDHAFLLRVEIQIVVKLFNRFRVNLIRKGSFLLQCFSLLFLNILCLLRLCKFSNFWLLF